MHPAVICFISSSLFRLSFFLFSCFCLSSLCERLIWRLRMDYELVHDWTISNFSTRQQFGWQRPLSVGNLSIHRHQRRVWKISRLTCTLNGNRLSFENFLDSRVKNLLTRLQFGWQCRDFKLWEISRPICKDWHTPCCVHDWHTDTGTMLYANSPVRENETLASHFGLLNVDFVNVLNTKRCSAQKFVESNIILHRGLKSGTPMWND